MTASQASRLDTGSRGLQPEQVRRLLDWYQIDTAERPRLLALASESRRRAWWQQHDLHDAYRTLIGMEQEAVTIDEYAGVVIPGLLQTEQYAKSSISATGEPRERVEMVAGIRLRRQAILDRLSPPNLWVVIDEVALARACGGSVVMRAQFEHLIKAANRPNITIQVIGFEYGLHPGGASHSIYLHMPGDELPDVYYTESTPSPISDTSTDSDLEQARARWDLLRAIALSPRDSLSRITRYAKGAGGVPPVGV